MTRVLAIWLDGFSFELADRLVADVEAGGAVRASGTPMAELHQVGRST